MKKKRAFSLIEILIAFVLAGILFACIFSNLFQTGKLQTRIEKMHAAATNRQQAQLRLRSLLSQLPLPQDEQNIQGEEPCLLYMADHTLWWHLTVDCASDRRFLGPITYGLYHNEKDQTLQLIVRNEQREEKIEEIMRGVKRCKILLYDPEKTQWTSAWSKKTKHLPSMLKLQITEKDQPEVLELAFPLPALQQVITLS